MVKRILKLINVATVMCGSSFIMLVLMGAGSCDRRTPGPDVKIYVSRPEKGGLYRPQSDEMILYADSWGYRALSPLDFDALLNWCLDPKNNKFQVKSEKKRKNIIENINRYYIDAE